MPSAQPSPDFLTTSTQYFRLQCRLQSSTRTSHSTHRHLLHQPFDFLGNWCQRGRRSFGVLGSRGSSWTSHWDHSLSASACHSCLVVLNYCIICLWFVFGFEHLACNVWWTMLVYVTLIYLCSFCGCEVVLTKLKFMPWFPLVGKTPLKVSNIYICVLDIHANLYAHIKGGVLSTHRAWWIYSYHILKFSRKMSKFFQSSIPSPPYA